MLQNLARRSPIILEMLAPYSPRTWKLAGLAVLAVPCLIVLFTYNPAQSGMFPPCPFRTLTGFDCPGCGTLRGLHQLLHGNLLAAMDLNPMMVLVLPFIVLAFSGMLVAEFTGRRMPSVFIPAKWIWALLGVIILFWTVRNIPVYPLTVLAS